MLPVLAAGLALVAVSGYASRRTQAGRLPDDALALLLAGVRHGLVLFLVPALAVRGRVGTPWLAADAALLLAVLAAVAAVREVAPAGEPRGGLLLRTGAAVTAGAGAGYAVGRLVEAPYYEVPLLAAAASALVVTVLLGGLLGRRPVHRGRVGGPA